MIATYGLRAGEIVSLRLDDVEWRARRLRVPQRKTGGVLWLPLTDEVATALLDYLREGRPKPAVRRYRRGFQTDPRQYREVFLRCRTPAGVLQSTAIAEAFQAWSRAKRIEDPFSGGPLSSPFVRPSPLAVRSVAQDDWRSPGTPHFGEHLRLSPAWPPILREVALSFPASASVPPAQENAR